ncbi:hypothetical protein D3C81_1921670 [compost metagenome]
MYSSSPLWLSASLRRNSLRAWMILALVKPVPPTAIFCATGRMMLPVVERELPPMDEITTSSLARFSEDTIALT